MLKEIDIKNALKTHQSILQSPLYHISQKDKTTIVVDELCVNNSSVRADVVAINGELHCFEIKSDADTFQRLDNQIHHYSKVFDKIYFITTEKHIDKIGNRLPNWIGIYEIKIKNNHLVFEILQKPKQNKDIDYCYLLNMIWNPELKLLLKSLCISGYTKMTLNEIYSTIIQNTNKYDLSYYIRSILKIRTEKLNWKQVNQTKGLYDEYVRFLSTQTSYQFLHQNFQLVA